MFFSHNKLTSEYQVIYCHLNRAKLAHEVCMCVCHTRLHTHIEFYFQCPKETISFFYLIEWYFFRCIILSLFTKECSYGNIAGQFSSSLIKFIGNSINIIFMSLNKFIIRIYSITNLIMILILYHDCWYLLYNFS